MINKMKNIKPIVKDLLERYPEFRDNDCKLVAGFYYKNYGGKESFERKTAMEFLIDFSKGNFPFPDHITRVRRKLQEQFPELRGSKYEERHKTEFETRKEIINL